MRDVYVAVVGFKYYLGVAPFKQGKVLHCVKEPDNPFDKRAVRVEGAYVGTLGYIANSEYTIVRGALSAKVLGKVMEKDCYIKVLFVMEHHVLCKVLNCKAKKAYKKYLKP